MAACASRRCSAVLVRDFISVHESQSYKSNDSINALNSVIKVSFFIGDNHTFDNALRAAHALFWCQHHEDGLCTHLDTIFRRARTCEEVDTVLC